MRHACRLLLIVFLVLLPAQVAAQQSAPLITAPTEGQVIHGLVNVFGSSAGEGMILAELSFAYAADPTVWFPIAQIEQAVEQGLLAVWDTTRIADGEYHLRLRVLFQDGTTREAVVHNLRVRNTSPTETPSPVPTPTLSPTPTLPLADTPAPLPPPTATRRLTPTPLPPNPLTLPPQAIGRAMLHAAWIALLAFLLFLLLFRWRR